MRFSPYQMKILLEVYAGAPITATKDKQIFGETMEDFEARGFVQPVEDGFVPTQKLQVLIYHVLSAPDPVWAMPG